MPMIATTNPERLPGVETLADLAPALAATQPSRPRVTWYGTGQERVELSGTAVDNWAAKVAGFLADELDVGEGSTVGLALPCHWRAAVWLLGIWRTGASVVLGTVPQVCGAEIVVLPHPSPGAEPDLLAQVQEAGAEAIAVPLETLAGHCENLAPGVWDGAAEVRSQPDVYQPWAPAAPGTRAALIFEQPLSHQQLLASVPEVPTGTRLLSGADPAAEVIEWTAAWLSNGAVILHDPALTLAERRRIAVQENIPSLLG